MCSLRTDIYTLGRWKFQINLLVLGNIAPILLLFPPCFWEVTFCSVIQILTPVWALICLYCNALYISLFCVSFSQISAQVSSQVRKELQALFFGGGVSGEEQGEVPESLILWLSQRYVSTPDLKASLSSLELSILRNVSLQLEQNRAQTLGEAESQAKTIIKTVTGTVQHTASAEGMSEEVMNVRFYCQYQHRRVALLKCLFNLYLSCCGPYSSKWSWSSKTRWGSTPRIEQARWTTPWSLEVTRRKPRI